MELNELYETIWNGVTPSTERYDEESYSIADDPYEDATATRRQVLRGAAGIGVAAVGAGCLNRNGSVPGQYTGEKVETGADTVTVKLVEGDDHAWYDAPLDINSEKGGWLEYAVEVPKQEERYRVDAAVIPNKERERFIDEPNPDLNPINRDAPKTVEQFDREGVFDTTAAGNLDQGFYYLVVDMSDRLWTAPPLDGRSQSQKVNVHYRYGDWK